MRNTELIEEMEKEKNELLKEIKKHKDYRIIYMKNFDSKKFYLLINVKDKFYYIEKSLYNYYNITLYNRINANEKRQGDYSINKEDIKNIITYIENTKNKYYNNLSDTYNQKIFHDLLIIINKNNEKITIYNHLKDVSGYREKEILKNLNLIIEEKENENYHILRFEDTKGDYFKINTKNIDRLIIG